MMRGRALAVAGIALLLPLLLAACSRDVPQATREGPIVAFGDSQVYGTGSSGGGFVKLLEQRIGRPIENMGVPGNTTADGVAVLLAGVRGGLIRDNFADRVQPVLERMLE